jgi:hypothetical protein
MQRARAAICTTPEESFMWIRLGRWVEMRVHFGTWHMPLHTPNRYLVYISIRFGKSEWYHGPHRLETSGYLRIEDGPSFPTHVGLYPDPEPLSWDIKR